MNVGVPGRGCARAVLAAAIALALTACATAPAGHRQFVIARDDAQGPSEWTLRGLPSAGRIRVQGRTLQETSRERVAHVRIDFVGGLRRSSLMTLDFHDRACAGAYEFSLQRLRDQDSIAFEYFDHKLAWGAPVSIIFEWSANGRMDVVVEGVGKTSVQLQGAPDRIALAADAGGLRVDDLELENRRGN